MSFNMRIDHGHRVCHSLRSAESNPPPHADPSIVTPIHGVIQSTRYRGTKKTTVKLESKEFASDTWHSLISLVLI